MEGETAAKQEKLELKHQERNQQIECLECKHVQHLKLIVNPEEVQVDIQRMLWRINC